jgi:hypothetical protein
VACILMVTAGAVTPASRYARPGPAERYVTVTPSHLFVVWSLPHDLSPVAHLLDDRPGLEAFMARTAIYLCGVNAADRKAGDRPCKVQVLRLDSNDEYSKSAVGAWRTAGVLVLPPERTKPGCLDASLALDHDALMAWFTRFDVRHDELRR